MSAGSTVQRGLQRPEWLALARAVAALEGYTLLVGAGDLVEVAALAWLFAAYSVRLAEWFAACGAADGRPEAGSLEALEGYNLLRTARNG